MVTLERRIADSSQELSECLYEAQAHGLISETEAEALNEDLQEIVESLEHALGTTIRQS